MLRKRNDLDLKNIQSLLFSCLNFFDFFLNAHFVCHPTDQQNFLLF